MSLKLFLFNAGLFLCIPLLAQKNLLWDTAKVKPGTLLIGRYLNKEAEMSQAPLSFILEAPDSIKKLICAMASSKKIKPHTYTQCFSISLIQGNEELNSWWVFPAFNQVLYDEGDFYFDTGKIAHLHKLHPFHWRSETRSFITKSEYIAYFEKQKTDPAFLFAYAPEFKYEGHFEIEFPKTKQFGSPREIYEYLGPRIETTIGDKNYTLTCSKTEKDLKHPQQYTIVIHGPKTLFEKLEVPGLKNTNWQNTDEKAEFFYRVD